jgi:hypothetical protein
MMQWKPIETAPKDGSPFIGLWAWCDQSHEVRTWWNDGRWESPFETEESDSFPTFWVPLPEPPCAE